MPTRASRQHGLSQKAAVGGRNRICGVSDGETAVSELLEHGSISVVGQILIRRPNLVASGVVGHERADVRSGRDCFDHRITRSQVAWHAAGPCQRDIAGRVGTVDVDPEPCRSPLDEPAARLWVPGGGRHRHMWLQEQSCCCGGRGPSAPGGPSSPGKRRRAALWKHTRRIRCTCPPASACSIAPPDRCLLAAAGPASANPVAPVKQRSRCS